VYQYWGRCDYQRALREFETARAGVPAETINLIGAIKRRQGRFDEAIRDQMEAVGLDPRSTATMVELAISLILSRRYGEAEQVVDRALKIAPDFTVALMMKALVHEAWKGETDLSKAVLSAVRGRLDPRGRLGLHWVIQLLEHHPAEALLFLDSIESTSFADSRAVYPKAFLYAVAHEALGEEARARERSSKRRFRCCKRKWRRTRVAPLSTSCSRTRMQDWKERRMQCAKLNARWNSFRSPRTHFLDQTWRSTVRRLRPASAKRMRPSSTSATCYRSHAFSHHPCCASIPDGRHCAMSCASANWQSSTASNVTA
jgi:tetratricopeptide (TPR) repeat protein